MATKNKSSFKFKIPGLFEFESEECSIKQMLLIAMIMAFIITIISLLKNYAIPTLGTTILINKVGSSLGKFLKSRAP